VFSYVVILSVLLAAEPGSAPRDGWSLLKSDHQSGVFAPQAGTLSGNLHGEAKFDDATGALLFDGRTTRIALGELTAAKLPKQALTVEAWARVDAPKEWGGLVSAIQDNGSYERGWLLGYRQDRFCFAVASQKKNRLTYLTAKAPFASGAWYHLVGTYDGKHMRIYVDGRLSTESAAQSGPIAYPPKGFFDLGAYHDDNELYPLEGAMASLAIFDTCLSAEEIAARFKSGEKKIPQVAAEPDHIVGWPTYRRDNRRSGAAPDDLPPPLKLAWSFHARHAPQPAWPPPAKQDFWHGKSNLQPRVVFDRAMHVVSDGQRIYFGSSACDKVTCLDLQDGSIVWEAFAGGPVRLAPTLHDGKVYFAADDAVATCLNATTGEVLWRQSLAPSDQRIAGNGRLISSWPIRTGVLIDQGQVRLAAGLFPNQGVWQFALDPQSGKVLQKAQINFSPQGYLERTPQGLTVAQGRSPRGLIAKLERAGKTVSAALGAAPEKYPFAFIGAGDIRYAGGADEVAAFSASSGELLWKAPVAGHAYSLAVAGERLFVSTDQGVIHCFAPAAALAAQPTAGIIRPETTPREESSTALGDTSLSLAREQASFCLIVGAEHLDLAVELSQRRPWKIAVLEEDGASVELARRRLDAAGLYGQISVIEGSADSLPFAEGMFNLALAPSASDATSLKEIARVLRPAGGVAILPGGDSKRLAAANKEAAECDARVVEIDSAPWLTLTRQPLAGAGEWTHMYGSPDNACNSGDTRVKGEFRMQWFGEPGPRLMLDRHHRTVPPLAKDGRLFVPADNRVIGVDAYNGSILWSREIPYSRRVAAMRDAGSMAVGDDALFVAAKTHCLAIDPASGEELHRTFAPASDRGPREWGYTATVDDLLLGSAVEPGASRTEHSRKQINETYWDHIPIVTSSALFAANSKTGKEQWRYEARGGIVNPTITVGGKRMYFVESKAADTLAQPRSRLAALLGDGASLVALDVSSGQEVWRRDVDLSMIEHHLYLAYSDDKLVLVGSKNKRALLRNTVWYDLFGFHAASGESLWQATQNQNQGAGGDHGEQDHHPAIVNGVVYQEPLAYDLATGKKIETWKFARGGHGCGTISACPSAFFFRAGNPTMCDLTTGEKSRITQVSRPGCWINILPAGGMVLVPEASSGCTCNFPLQTSLGLWPK